MQAGPPSMEANSPNVVSLSPALIRVITKNTIAAKPINKNKSIKYGLEFAAVQPGKRSLETDD